MATYTLLPYLTFLPTKYLLYESIANLLICHPLRLISDTDTEHFAHISANHGACIKTFLVDNLEHVHDATVEKMQPVQLMLSLYAMLFRSQILIWIISVTVAK